MTKLLTLQEWCDATYSSNPPPISTLWKWARTGCIFPAPEKHGKTYRVKADAIYINPKSYRMARDAALKPSAPAETPPLPLLERLKNGEKARKI